MSLLFCMTVTYIETCGSAHLAGINKAAITHVAEVAFYLLLALVRSIVFWSFTQNRHVEVLH